VFDPILDVLLKKGDFYLHLADLPAYSDAHSRLGRFYGNPVAWTHAAIMNVASSGKFSSDRTIAQYASEIWKVVPCPTGEIISAARNAV
jgi:starch phosphorylase